MGGLIGRVDHAVRGMSVTGCRGMLSLVPA